MARAKSTIREIQEDGESKLPRDLREFRKTNDAIGLRLRQGSMSLLARKIFNVLIFHAQTSKEKGRGAPEETETSASFFWVPLAQLIRDAAYDSNDVKLIKKHLLELQNIRILSEDAKEWVSESLLASVKLSSPRYGLKSSRGQIFVGYAFPPEVERMVMSPGAYTKLSIYYQGLLRRGASLALYEICRRYATNPSKMTNRAPTDWWYHTLTGSAVSQEVEEYRYFKRDTLKPAIAEINAVTDIQVELVEHTRGRKVLELQFRVMQTKQPPLILDAPVIDSEVIRRMMALGLSGSEANQLYATNEDARLRATLDLTEARMKNTKAAPLESPVAYFKKALQQNYASPIEVAQKSLEKTKKPDDTESLIDKIREQYIAARAKDAYEMYRELDDAQKKARFEEFKMSDQSKGINLARGLGSTPARTAFSLWLAEQTWPEPTDTDLLRFSATRAK